MNNVSSFLRQQAPRIVAFGLLCALYGLARLPVITTAERDQLATQFRFIRTAFRLESPNQEYRSIRAVNPSLRKIAAWISATGAGVALNDIDGDGLSNDVCLVDPRSDSIIVTPAPATPPRYSPFTLDAGPLFNRDTMAPMGCIPADLNEDGLTDILVYYWGRTPIVFLAKTRASQKETLTNASYYPQELVAGGERWFTGGATVADLDGDGHLDIAIGNYFQDGAEILDAKSNTGQHMQHSMTRAFNAGRSRLLRWVGGKAGQTPSAQYQEVKDYVEAGPQEVELLTRGWTLAIGAADLDKDMLPELYFANDFGPDRLLYNRSRPGSFRFTPLKGAKTLTTPNSKVLSRDSFKGMGIDFGDVNSDGTLDMFVSNIAAPYSLEESHFLFLSKGETTSIENGIAPYYDASEEMGVSRSGWGWDAKFADFNNDGTLELIQATGFIKGGVNRWPELHELAMGNDQLLKNPANWHNFTAGDALSDSGHNPFFVQASDGRFYDIADKLDLDQPQITRGIATADVNGDGRLDFAVANQWDTSYFFLNDGPQNNAFLGLHLRLSVSGSAQNALQVCNGHPVMGMLSRPAVGAWATVRLPSGKQLISFVDGGNGHSGKRSPDLLLGLGAIPQDTKLQVELRWRDIAGKVQQTTLTLSPGWHTVLLGGPGENIGGTNGCQ
jgi:hypothetical protein